MSSRDRVKLNAPSPQYVRSSRISRIHLSPLNQLTHARTHARQVNIHHSTFQHALLKSHNKVTQRKGDLSPYWQAIRAIERKHQKKTNRLCATSALSLREQHMSLPEHLLQHRTDANTQTASTRWWMLSESLIFITPKPLTCIKLYSPLP
jgi:hypothetical protein